MNSMTILVVEDDETITRLIAEVLESDLGAEVICFTRAEPALAYLKKTTVLPALLIVDLMLPGLDGETFMLHVREQFGPELPMMVVSAAAPPVARASATRAAAQSFLAKPFELQQLVEEVRSVLWGEPELPARPHLRLIR
ncbi:MAG TPA: response regulator [Chloroflexota bacterium]|nr:response regulator [Chloroflexota bacterium]